MMQDQQPHLGEEARTLDSLYEGNQSSAKAASLGEGSRVLRRQPGFYTSLVVVFPSSALGYPLWILPETALMVLNWPYFGEPTPPRPPQLRLLRSTYGFQQSLMKECTLLWNLKYVNGIYFGLLVHQGIHHEEDPPEGPCVLTASSHAAAKLWLWDNVIGKKSREQETEWSAINVSGRPKYKGFGWGHKEISAWPSQP